MSSGPEVDDSLTGARGEHQPPLLANADCWAPLLAGTVHTRQSVNALLGSVVVVICKVNVQQVKVDLLSRLNSDSYFAVLACGIFQGIIW